MKKLFLILFIVNCSLPIVKSQWIQQTVPVTKPITGIKFINANTGWACTSIGMGGLNYCYILGTTNGGTTWVIQDSTFDATYGAISVINSNIVYCGGYDFSSNSGNLKKTVNGGINWILIPTPTNMAIGDMVFLDQDSGWSCSDNVGADVRTTTNGGLNWIVRTSGIAAQTQRIFFLNYNTGFCGANNNILYKTTNAGLNWFPNGTFSQPVQSIFFLNENTGWVGLSLNRMYFTNNGGINWIQQTLPPNSNSNVLDIQFLNSSTGYAGTSFDKIFKTTDGGLNWGYQIDTGASYRISFINDQTGWTGSLGERIAKTTNGGGNIIYSGINNISTEIPSQFKLYQNYPNPFNPLTTIKVDIPKSSQVNFIIFDILGKVLYQENEYLSAGSYEFKWDVKNNSTGIYFYRIIADNFTETKKMILVK